MVGAKLANENAIAPWARRSLDNVLLSARAHGPGQAFITIFPDNLLVSYKLRTNTCSCRSVDYVHKLRKDVKLYQTMRIIGNCVMIIINTGLSSVS